MSAAESGSAAGFQDFTRQYLLRAHLASSRALVKEELAMEVVKNPVDNSMAHGVRLRC